MSNSHQFCILKKSQRPKDRIKVYKSTQVELFVVLDQDISKLALLYFEKYKVGKQKNMYLLLLLNFIYCIVPLGEGESISNEGDHKCPPTIYILENLKERKEWNSQLWFLFRGGKGESRSREKLQEGQAAVSRHFRGGVRDQTSCHLMIGVATSLLGFRCCRISKLLISGRDQEC